MRRLPLVLISVWIGAGCGGSVDEPTAVQESKIINGDVARSYEYSSTGWFENVANIPAGALALIRPNVLIGCQHNWNWADCVPNPPQSCATNVDCPGNWVCHANTCWYPGCEGAQVSDTQIAFGNDPGDAARYDQTAFARRTNTSGIAGAGGEDFALYRISTKQLDRLPAALHPANLAHETPLTQVTLEHSPVGGGEFTLDVNSAKRAVDWTCGRGGQACIQGEVYEMFTDAENTEGHDGDSGSPFFIRGSNWYVANPSFRGGGTEDGEIDNGGTPSFDSVFTGRLPFVWAGDGLDNVEWIQQRLVAWGIEGSCTDGVDDDGDGRADCSDDDCIGHPSCWTAESSTGRRASCYADCRRDDSITACNAHCDDLVEDFDALFDNVCFDRVDGDDDGVPDEDEASCRAPFLAVEGFDLEFNHWMNHRDDDIDWSRRSGSTPSWATGPSGAAVGTHYAYVESSWPNNPGRTAILRSKWFNRANYALGAVQFRYHMYGSSMGSLALQCRNADGTWRTLRTIAGDQGNQWRLATEQITCTGVTRLRFVATTGTSYRSDIALDDVRLIENDF